MYYKKRTAGTWSARTAVEHGTPNNPMIMVRAPYDATYRGTSGGLYWKTSTSGTYFHIPEFPFVAAPMFALLLLVAFRRRWRKARGGRLEATP